MEIRLDRLCMSISHGAASFAMGVSAKNSFLRSEFIFFRRNLKIRNLKSTKFSKFCKSQISKISKISNFKIMISDRKIEVTESVREHF